jgi:hypothetical protein
MRTYQTQSLDDQSPAGQEVLENVAIEDSLDLCKGALASWDNKSEIDKPGIPVWKACGA